MKFLSQIFFIARIEFQHFARYPKLFLATAVIVVIPSLYAVIYLSSVWDPAANTGAMAVGVVNLDDGVEYREHRFNVGQEVVARLQTSGRFGFRVFDDEQYARQMVRDGHLAFALIIPRGFSSNAVPGAEQGGGKLVIYTSEGNNFESATIARHFAQTLGQDVNESLNERRWALVLTNAAGSQRSVDRLRSGVGQLRAGAHELSAGTAQSMAGARGLAGGANRVREGVGQLTSGVKQLGNGLKTMDARRPPNSELRRLSAGAEALAAGHVEMGEGLEALQIGTQRLHEGVVMFQSEAKASVFTPAKVNESLGQLADGVTQLDTGLLTAANAQQKLTDGANRLSSGVGALTTGVRAMNTGVRTMVEKLPEDRQLDELNKGAGDLAGGTVAVSDAAQKIHAGAQQLAAGIDLLAQSLPVTAPQIDGSPQGLANSVQPVVEVDAPVQNSGSGFAANVIPGALWLGAGVAVFLIHVRMLPRPARFFSAPAQCMGKLLWPSGVVLVQAVLVLWTVLYVLKMRVMHPGPFAITLCIASLTFLWIVFALTRAFGDAGKGMAMIFLAVQLSSSGAVLPVELSGGLFLDISPWLPLTWVVRAIKASMFGAYDSHWQEALRPVVVAGVVAATMACCVGRWRFIKPNAIRPPMEF